jgi:hypothetical protein
LARFLSERWFADVQAAAPDPGGEPVAVLEQAVEGGPAGSVVYRVEMLPAGARIVWPVPDEAPAPALRITCGWDTAVAIARGELSTTRALMEGRLRVRGDLRRLPAAGSGGDPVPAPVRAATAYAGD